jgi:hypothetical protein
MNIWDIWDIWICWMRSRAAVEGDEVFPEDAEAGEFGAGDVALIGGVAVGVGDAEEGADLGPGSVVDGGHGLVGGVEEVVLELGGGGDVGESGDELEPA